MRKRPGLRENRSKKGPFRTVFKTPFYSFFVKFSLLLYNWIVKTCCSKRCNRWKMCGCFELQTSEGSFLNPLCCLIGPLCLSMGDSQKQTPQLHSSPIQPQCRMHLLPSALHAVYRKGMGRVRFPNRSLCWQDQSPKILLFLKLYLVG